MKDFFTSNKWINQDFSNDWLIRELLEIAENNKTSKVTLVRDFATLKRALLEGKVLVDMNDYVTDNIVMHPVIFNTFLMPALEGDHLSTIENKCHIMMWGAIVWTSKIMPKDRILFCSSIGIDARAVSLSLIELVL